MDHASNPSTRKAAHQAYEARLAVNVEPLNTILCLRKEIAEVLQYDSWADYATEVKMSKSAANVKEASEIKDSPLYCVTQICMQFLDELKRYLDPIAKKELEAIITLKNEDYTTRGLPIDGSLYTWDSRYVIYLVPMLKYLIDSAALTSRYYNRLYVERSLSLDGSLVKEYFPVSFVVPAILDIYQSLLGVKFVEIDGEAKDVWHSGESSLHPYISRTIDVYADVQQFAVWEKDAQDESGFVGYCYLDLFPRGMVELCHMAS